MITYIYALIEPDTNTIRYIGKSDNPKKRLRIHLTEARKNNHISHRVNWLRKLIQMGKKPRLIILEVCNVNEWADCERKWIAKYRTDGVELVNNTDGGEGAVGYKHPIVAIDKIVVAQIKSWADPTTHTRRSLAMRGIKKSGDMRKSVETRIKMSIAQRGKKNSLGYVWTKEQRERLSKALITCGKMVRKTSFKKGMVLSEETKKKLSEANKRKEKNP